MPDPTPSPSPSPSPSPAPTPSPSPATAPVAAALAVTGDWVLASLHFLSGFLHDEIDPTALVRVVDEALVSHEGDWHSQMTAAVLAIEENSGFIFRKDDWFKGLALRYLNHLATPPAPEESPHVG